MITGADIEKLKAVFATKDDLIGMERRMDAKYASKDDLNNALTTNTKMLVELIGDEADSVKKSIRNEIRSYREDSIKIKTMVYTHELRLDKIN